jgi:hypothetical protein
MSFAATAQIFEDDQEDTVSTWIEATEPDAVEDGQIAGRQRHPLAEAGDGRPQPARRNGAQPLRP